MDIAEPRVQMLQAGAFYVPDRSKLDEPSRLNFSLPNPIVRPLRLQPFPPGRIHLTQFFPYLYNRALKIMAEY